MLKSKFKVKRMTINTYITSLLLIQFIQYVLRIFSAGIYTIFQSMDIPVSLRATFFPGPLGNMTLSPQTFRNERIKASGNCNSDSLSTTVTAQ